VRLTLRPIVDFRFDGGVGLGHFVLTLVIILVVARSPLIVETRLAIAENSEIMVRELQIIFGLDAVARELRVTRHALILLEQLRGVATLAIVLAIAGLSALASLAPATAPAAALTIVDQMSTSLRGSLHAPLPGQAGQHSFCPAFRSSTLRSADQTADASGVGTGCALQFSWWSGPDPRP
jgi:hypothetical protein